MAYNYTNNENINQKQEDLILNKLFDFNYFNKKLDNLNWGNNFIDFYAINTEWMANYLNNNRYKEFLSLIQEFEEDNDGENIREIAKKTNILKNRVEYYPFVDESKNEFEPKKEKIPKDEYNDEDKEYFSEFILIEENFYNEIEKTIKIRKNIDKFELLKNKVNIMKLNNIFIYKITDNILGFGYIPEKVKDQDFIIYKVKYLMILKKNSEFNYNTEIVLLNRNNNLENYLYKERHLDFKNNYQKNSILYNYEGTQDIGMFYFLEKKDCFETNKGLNEYLRFNNKNNVRYHIESVNPVLISRGIKESEPIKRPFNFLFKKNPMLFNRKNNINEKEEEKKQEINNDNNKENTNFSESIESDSFQNYNNNSQPNFSDKTVTFNNYVNTRYNEIVNIINTDYEFNDNDEYFN